MKVVMASSNEGKIEEVKRILEKFGARILTLADVGIDPDVELPEDGNTFEHNALSKTSALLSLVGGDYWCLGDDSGLAVDALGGAPGVRSARWAGVQKGPGRDRANLEKLLADLAGVPEQERTARFVCHMVLLGPKGEQVHSRGICEGLILFEPKGESGFGYDPIFLPSGFERTMAQLEMDEKNRISHRGRALEGLVEKMREQGFESFT